MCEKWHFKGQYINFMGYLYIYYYGKRYIVVSIVDIKYTVILDNKIVQMQDFS